MNISFKKPIALDVISQDINYIMCIDENGSDGLFKNAIEKIKNNQSVDINDKYLTITGVIFTRSEYANAYFEINQIKNKYWENGKYEEFGKQIAVCLHSRDIRTKKRPFDDNTIDRAVFCQDLSLLLDNLSCKIISSTIDIEKYILENYKYDIYSTALQFLLERYIYATKNKNIGIIVLESRNPKENNELLKKINNLFNNGTSIIKAKEFEEKIIGIYFNNKRTPDKNSAYAGLEISDLFSYPIHKYIRTGKKDDSFKIIEKKLDKGINKGIKIFPIKKGE